MTPTVKAAVKRRNRLRREVQTKRKEWLEACKEASAEIRKAKEECWKDFLEDVITEENQTQLWKTIKNLNGSPDTNSPSEAMQHNGRTITTNKAKANRFMQHYAGISKLRLTKKDRTLNRKLKQALDPKPTVGDASTANFRLKDLKKAISAMKAKLAAGPDDIPPTFLKAMGPLAQVELLDIFNKSYDSAEIPQAW